MVVSVYGETVLCRPLASVLSAIALWVLKKSVIGVSFWYEYHRYQVSLRSTLVKSWLPQGVLSVG